MLKVVACTTTTGLVSVVVSGCGGTEEETTSKPAEESKSSDAADSGNGNNQLDRAGGLHAQNSTDGTDVFSVDKDGAGDQGTNSLFSNDSVETESSSDVDENTPAPAENQKGERELQKEKIVAKRRATKAQAAQNNLSPDPASTKNNEEKPGAKEAEKTPKVSTPPPGSDTAAPAPAQVPGKEETSDKPPTPASGDGVPETKETSENGVTTSESQDDDGGLGGIMWDAAATGLTNAFSGIKRAVSSVATNAAEAASPNQPAQTGEGDDIKPPSGEPEPASRSTETNELTEEERLKLQKEQLLMKREDTSDCLSGSELLQLRRLVDTIRLTKDELERSQTNDESFAESFFKQYQAEIQKEEPKGSFKCSDDELLFLYNYKQMLSVSHWCQLRENNAITSSDKLLESMQKGKNQNRYEKLVQWYKNLEQPAITWSAKELTFLRKQTNLPMNAALLLYINDTMDATESAECIKTFKSQYDSKEVTNWSAEELSLLYSKGAQLVGDDLLTLRQALDSKYKFTEEEMKRIVNDSQRTKLLDFLWLLYNKDAENVESNMSKVELDLLVQHLSGLHSAKESGDASSRALSLGEELFLCKHGSMTMSAEETEKLHALHESYSKNDATPFSTDNLLLLRSKHEILRAKDVLALRADKNIVLTNDELLRIEQDFDVVAEFHDSIQWSEDEVVRIVTKTTTGIEKWSSFEFEGRTDFSWQSVYGKIGSGSISKENVYKFFHEKNITWTKDDLIKMYENVGCKKLLKWDWDDAATPNQWTQVYDHVQKNGGLRKQLDPCQCEFFARRGVSFSFTDLVAVYDKFEFQNMKDWNVKAPGISEKDGWRKIYDHRQESFLQKQQLPRTILTSNYMSSSPYLSMQLAEYKFFFIEKGVDITVDDLVAMHKTCGYESLKDIPGSQILWTEFYQKRKEHCKQIFQVEDHEFFRTKNIRRFSDGDLVRLYNLYLSDKASREKVLELTDSVQRSQWRKVYLHRRKQLSQSMDQNEFEFFFINKKIECTANDLVTMHKSCGYEVMEKMPEETYGKELWIEFFKIRQDTPVGLETKDYDFFILKGLQVQLGLQDLIKMYKNFSGPRRSFDPSGVKPDDWQALYDCRKDPEKGFNQLLQREDYDFFKAKGITNWSVDDIYNLYTTHGSEKMFDLDISAERDVWQDVYRRRQRSFAEQYVANLRSGMPAKEYEFFVKKGISWPAEDLKKMFAACGDHKAMRALESGADGLKIQAEVPDWQGLYESRKNEFAQKTGANLRAGMQPGEYEFFVEKGISWSVEDLESMMDACGGPLQMQQWEKKYGCTIKVQELAGGGNPWQVVWSHRKRQQWTRWERRKTHDEYLFFAKKDVRWTEEEWKYMYTTNICNEAAKLVTNDTLLKAAYKNVQTEKWNDVYEVVKRLDFDDDDYSFFADKDIIWSIPHLIGIYKTFRGDRDELIKFYNNAGTDICQEVERGLQDVEFNELDYRFFTEKDIKWSDVRLVDMYAKLRTNRDAAAMLRTAFDKVETANVNNVYTILANTELKFDTNDYDFFRPKEIKWVLRHLIDIFNHYKNDADALQEICGRDSVDLYNTIQERIKTENPQDNLQIDDWKYDSFPGEQIHWSLEHLKIVYKKHRGDPNLEEICGYAHAKDLRKLYTGMVKTEVDKLAPNECKFFVEVFTSPTKKVLWNPTHLKDIYKEQKQNFKAHVEPTCSSGTNFQKLFDDLKADEFHFSNEDYEYFEAKDGVTVVRSMT